MLEKRLFEACCCVVYAISITNSLVTCRGKTVQGIAYKGSANSVLAKLGRTTGAVVEVVSVQGDLVTITVEHHGPVVVSRKLPVSWLFGRSQILLLHGEKKEEEKRGGGGLPVASGRVFGLAIKLIVG